LTIKNTVERKENKTSLDHKKHGGEKRE